MSEDVTQSGADFTCVGCALCDVTHGERHARGEETLTDTFNRAWRNAIALKGFRELGLRDGRSHRRLVCPRCAGDVARADAAPAPAYRPSSTIMEGP